MKFSLFLAIIALLFALVSCSPTDVKPNLEHVSLSFMETNKVTDAPLGIQSSADANAQLVNTLITSTSNGLISYFYFMKPSAAAVKSTTTKAVVTTIPNSTGNFMAYTWDDSGKRIAYQITETTTGYVFETFITLPGEHEWLSYSYAEERKDRSKGLFIVFDILGTDRLAKLIEYTWTRSHDVLTFESSGNFAKELDPSIIVTINQVLVSNEKTKEGSLITVENGEKKYESSWDAVGNGTWTFYEGSKTLNGSWKI